MYKNGGVNPRQPVDQDLSVSPNINALRATDSYLYKYYMLFSLKYQLVFILFLKSHVVKKYFIDSYSRHKKSKSCSKTKFSYNKSCKSHTECKHSSYSPNNCFCKINNRNSAGSRYPHYDKFMYKKPCYRKAGSVS